MKIIGLIYAATVFILTTFILVVVPFSIEGEMDFSQTAIISLLGFAGYLSVCLLIWAVRADKLYKED